MANLDYLESGGYTPPKHSAEGGNLEDYTVTNNVFGMGIYHPELSMPKEQTAWTPESKMETLKTLKDPNSKAMLLKSDSVEEFNTYLARREVTQEAEDRMMNDNAVFRFGASAGLAIADPSIIIPGTVAFKTTRMAGVLGRVAYGVGVGAGLGYTQESILASQGGRQDEAGTAALYGAAFMGAINSIPGMVYVGNKVRSSKAAKAFTKPDTIEEAVTTGLNKVEYTPGSNHFTYEKNTKIQEYFDRIKLDDVPVLKQAYEAEIQSYKKEGKVSPIVVDYKDGELYVKQGRAAYKVAKKYGLEDVDIQYTDKVPKDKKFTGKEEVKVTIQDVEYHDGHLIDNKDAVTEGQAPIIAEYGEVPKLNGFLTKFVISPVSRLAKATTPAFRKLGAVLQSSPIHRYNKDGSLFKEGRNASDFKAEYLAAQAQSIRKIETAYLEAADNGEFIGKLDDYKLEVKAAMDDIQDSALTEATLKLEDELRQNVNVMGAEMQNIKAKYDAELEAFKLKTSKTIKDKDKATLFIERKTAELQKKIDKEVAAIRKDFNENYVMPTNDKYGERLSELLHEADRNVDISKYPKYLQKGIKEYQAFNRKYADDMIALGMKKADELYPNIYKTRAFALDKIRNLSFEDLVRVIDKAFREEAVNKSLMRLGILTEEKVAKEVSRIAKHIEEIELIRDMPDNTLTVPNKMPLGQYLEARKIRLNDKYLGDILEQDLFNVMKDYSYKQSGRMALHKTFGTSDLLEVRKAYLEPAMKEAKEAGLPSKEIAAMAEDFDTLFTQVLGTHGLPAKPNGWAETAKRILQKLNYLTFGGGFGINALTDMGVVGAKTGLINALNHVKPALLAIKNMKKVGKGELKWVEDAMAIGAAADYYNMRALSRFDEVDGVVIGNRMDRFLGHLSTSMTKLSGLGPITAIEEIVAVGAGTVDMFKKGQQLLKTGKIDDYYLKQIAGYGLDAEDLKWMAKQPVIMKNGVLVDFNFKAWDDVARTKKIQEGLTRLMEDVIIRGDKTLLPNVMTTSNPIGQLMFQFMRYPVVAYERILLSGLSNQSARFYAGVMTSMGITASLYYLREQALIAADIIDERDAKYDIFDKHGNFDDEALTRLAVLVTSKMPQLGFLPDVMSKTFALSGVPMPGRTYPETAYTAIGGVSASRFDALHRAMKGVYEGTFDSMDSVRLAQQYLPFANLWQINQIYNPILEKELR